MKDKTLIMIVDDDPNIAQLVKLYLEKDGYDTVAYGRGDEALAAFSALEYWGQYHGQAARQELEQSTAEYALRVTVSQGVTPGCPLDRFSTMSEYSLVVYDRGLALLCALDRLSGGLDGALAAYYQAYAFSLASRDDFETCISQATGEDIRPLLRDYLDTYILH